MTPAFLKPRLLDHHEIRRRDQRKQLAAMRVSPETAVEAPETLAALVTREMAKGTADGLRCAGLALLRAAERLEA